MNHPVKRVLVIDGYDTYAMSRSIGFQIDFKKLLNWAKADVFLAKSTYATWNTGNTDHNKLYDWLRYNDYNVIEIDINDKLSIEPFVISEMFAIPDCDQLVLFASNPNYLAPIKTLVNIGVKTTLVSSFKAKMPIMNLVKSSSEFLSLEELQPVFERIVNKSEDK